MEKEEDVVDPADADIYAAAPAIEEPGGDHSIVMGKDEAEIVVTEFDPSLTPWERRYGVGNKPKALPILFGAGVFYYPPPTKTAVLPKVAPRLQYGIFLGYVFEPGGRWNNKYSVAAIEDFMGKDLHRSHLGRGDKGWRIFGKKGN